MMKEQIGIRPFRQRILNISSILFAALILTLTINGCSNKFNVNTYPTANNTPTQSVVNDSNLTPDTTAPNSSNSTPVLIPYLNPKINQTNTPIHTATRSPIRDPYTQIVYSPDNQWVAKLYSEYVHPSQKTTIEIMNTSETVNWAIPYQGKMPTGAPRPSLRIHSWSQDNLTLYFYYAFSYDGAHTLWSGYRLQKFDVVSGSIRQVLPGTGLMAFSFSSSGKWIAYTRNIDHPRRLIIRHLTRGTEKSIIIEQTSEDYLQAGWIEWSPSGEGILFYTYENRNFQAIYFDIESMEQTILLNPLWGDYWFHSWTPDNNLRFISSGQAQTIIEINVSTGERTTIGTVTPTP